MSKLFVVATPIGNLKDITLRALEILKSVDVVFAEDTRVARKLLSHFDIAKPIEAFHKFSPKRVVERVGGLLQEGKDIALITDAGTPSISDPGHWLMKLLLQNSRQNIQSGGPEFFSAEKTLKTRAVALRTSSRLNILSPYNGIEIIPIPGPSAITALISVSDIDCSQFTFFGFPPHKKGRKTFFERLAKNDVPTILFESPHRITKTLKELEMAAGDRYINVGRELTKIYEEVFRGTLKDAQRYFAGEKERGEFVIIVGVV